MDVRIILGVAVSIVGLIVGSFLNVLILRGDSGKGRHKRSICLSCGGELKPRDLFPVVSYFILRGRCRHCKCLISWQYPIVEILSALLFLVSFLFVYKNILVYLSSIFAILDWVLLCAISAISIIILIYDLQHKIILDRFAVMLAGVAIIRLLLVHFFVFNDSSLLLNILAGILAPFPFFILWLISGGRWMGLGDAKIMVGLGFLVGWQYFVSSIIMAFWLGALVIMLLFIIKLISRKVVFLRFNKLFSILRLDAEVPFAPFLIVSALISLFLEFNVLNFIYGVLV